MSSTPAPASGPGDATFVYRDFGNSPRGDIFEQRSGLVAPTQGDAVRHMIVRGEFLQHFLQDERIQALYADWAGRPGLVDQILYMRLALEDVAAMAGLPSCRDVWDYAQGGEPQEPLRVGEPNVPAAR